MASAMVFPDESPAASARAATDTWRPGRAEPAREVTEHRRAQPSNPAKPAGRTVSALDVRAALARLAPEHRAVITEMCLNERSAAETAEILGIPDGTVESRSYYALRTLRESIARSARPESSAPP